MPRSTKWQSKRKYRAGGRTNKDESCSSSRPSPPKVTSASKRKLEASFEKYEEYNCFSKNVILSMDIFSDIFKHVACKECCSEVIIEEDTDSRLGLACKLVLKCTNRVCKSRIEFWTSERLPLGIKTFEINCRLFYGLRSIGKGQEAGKMLCGIMNLPQPGLFVSKYTNLLRDSLYSVAQKSMDNAVKEAIDENSEEPIPTDIPIAFDGTWQKRGFVSKNAACTVTSIDTGKVLDVEVLTKYCSGCEAIKNKAEKKPEHQQFCVKYYQGSSGGMETVAAVAVCQRSVATKGVRYLKFLGDGDSKVFSAVCDSRPYGNTLIQKLECIGHVKKRMGCRLRKLKQKLGSTPLSDGKSIKGAGRLTDTVIDRLQDYYGNAIKSNTDNLDKMKRAVWATYFHLLSTDETPTHQLCPPPPDTWCKFRKAELEQKPYTHKPIPKSIMEAIKPTFSALANPDLLKKCLHGKTQNVNESFNNVIWSRVPKNVFVGRKTLELGVFDALVTFNDGNCGKLKVLKGLGIKDCGAYTVKALKAADEARLRKAERAAQEATKEARLLRRRKRILEEEGKNTDYFPGGF